MHLRHQDRGVGAALGLLVSATLALPPLVAQAPASGVGAALLPQSAAADEAPVTGPSGPASLKPLRAPGRTFYVDAKSGDDRNEGTSRSGALRTLKEAVRRLSRAGGDKLVIRGRFAEPLRMNFINNPTGGVPDPNRRTIIQCDFDGKGRPLPAFIDGGVRGAAMFPYDKAQQPPGFGPGTGNYLDRGISISESNYVTVSGLHVRGIIGTGLITWRSSDVEVSHCTFRWLANSAMSFTRGSFGEPMVRNLRARYCHVNQTNLGSWVDRATRSGFSMSTETVNFVGVDGYEIAHSTISNSLMEGIDAKFDSRDGRIHHNVVMNTRSAGIYINEAQDTEVFRNLVQQTGYFDPQDGSGLQVAAKYCERVMPSVGAGEQGATGILVGNGDLGGPAFESGRCSGIRIYENIVCWTRKRALSVRDEWRAEGLSGGILTDIHVYNNVFYGGGQAPRLSNSALKIDVAVLNSTFCNNVIANSAKPGIDIWEASQGNFYGSNVIAYNLFWGNPPGGEQGSNPVLAPPEFFFAPPTPGRRGIFRLRPSSPAIDQGTSVLGIQSSGAGIDVGAHQFGLPVWSPGPAGG